MRSPATLCCRSFRSRRYSALLQRIQRRILDVGSRLGLSNTLMRVIEQRTEQDRYILLGGMAATALLMFLIYVYFG